MAVTKRISYVGPSGVLYTSTVTIDLEKIAVGTESDEEQVFLTMSAPGISASSYWRRNIEGLVEDGIFAASGGTEHETRYIAPSGDYAAYGDRLDNSEDGVIIGASGVQGVRQQLIDRATI